MNTNQVILFDRRIVKSISEKTVTERKVPSIGRNLRYENKPYRKMIKPDVKIEVKRKYPHKDFTIGEMWIDGIYFCDTLEDADRGWNTNTPTHTIEIEKEENNKHFGVVKYNSSLNTMVNAIPAGTYHVTLEKSKFADGWTPYLHNVPGFVGIRIHEGNDPTKSKGCILVGYNVNPEKAWLEGRNSKKKSSKQTIRTLVQKLEDVGNITITIRRYYGAYQPYTK